MWYYRVSWAAANPYQTTGNHSAAVQMAFFGDQATLTMGQGPDHSIYDIYLDAALWTSIDGYAASPGDRVISIVLDNEGPHIVDIRNRPEKNTASSGYTLRFKSLVTLAGAPKYDLRTLKYTYDALARLLDARYYPGINTSIADANLPRRYQYAFDRAGNRTQQVASVNGTPTTTNYTYDNANRITSDGANTYIHDNAGRLISWANFPLTWDRANRVLSFAANGTSWIYNGVGQRLRSTIANTTVTDYLLDVQPGLWRIIAFTDTQLGGTMRYVHEPNGQHTVQYPNGTWFWPLVDALNSSRVVVNTGLVVDGTREFSPYGDIVNQTGGFLTFLDFTGELVDTGPMNYLRAREYYAAPGRFLNLDPLEGDMSQPMSLNRYMYVQGNVVNAVDPNGLIPSFPGLPGTCAGSDFRPIVKAFNYNRFTAAKTAISMDLKGIDSYANDIYPLDAYSAMFMSLVLYAGGFPMTRGPAPDHSNVIDQTNGWRAKVIEGKIAGNPVWNNHNSADKNPSLDDRLIGYVWGTEISGGDRIFRLTASRQTGNIMVGDVFDGNIVNPTKLQTLMSSGRLSHVQQGDYVFIDSKPKDTHGLLVVGFGRAVSCEARGLNSLDSSSLSGNTIIAGYENSDTLSPATGSIPQVPYLSDWTRLQRSGPRPFYCTYDPEKDASGTPNFNRRFDHTFWNFISVPDAGLVAYINYFQSNFSVEADGTIVK